MKKLTTFIKGLLENGNAKLIETTDEGNVYRVTVCKFYKYSSIFGTADISINIEKYDEPLIINGEINQNATLVSSSKEKTPSDELEPSYRKLLCRLINNNLYSDKSIITNEKKLAISGETYVSPSIKEFLLNIAEEILGISNHSLASCVGTNLDYLERYLNEESLKNTREDSTEEKDINSIAEAEEDLISRIEHISSLAKRLKSADLTREEYNSMYPEWIALYEDREFHNCPSKGDIDEKKRSLLQDSKN